MKAIKKPIPIEVEEFQPEKLPWPHNVRASSGGKFFVYNALHNSNIKIQPGDYINVTDKTGGDNYPIDRATFNATYDVVGDD